MSCRTKPATAPSRPRDHLWVLLLIAACVLAEVWPSWVGIGAISGFPPIGRIPTDWVLAVAMEAYWAYTLWAWLVASPGPRSRSWAMWSCAVVFAFSVGCQVLDHELTAAAGTPPGRRFVIGFTTSLPVVVLALIAVLIHLRHLDRAEAAEAAQESALRAELDAERAARIAAEAEPQALRAELEAVRGELARSLTKAETLTRRLAARSAQGKRSRGSRKSARDDELTTELRAANLLDEHPELRGPRMGGELARRLGVSPATGRRLHGRLTGDERSGTGQG